MTLYHLAKISELTTAQRESCTGIYVPSEDIGFCSLEIPKVAKSKWAQLAPWLLEEQLLSPVADLHIAFGERDAEGKVPVAVVSHAVMTEWQQQLQQADLASKAILPDIYSLPHEAEQWVLACEENHAVVRTGENSGFAGNVEWVSELLESNDNPVKLYTDGKEVIQQIPAASRFRLDKLPEGNGAGIDLAQGNYKAERETVELPVKQWAAMVALPLLAAVLYLASLVVEGYQFNQLAQSYQQSLLRDYKQLYGSAYQGDIAQLRQEAAYLQRFAEHKQAGISGGIAGALVSVDRIVSRCNGCGLMALEAKDDQIAMRFNRVDDKTEQQLRKLVGFTVEKQMLDNGVLFKLTQRSDA